MRSPRFYYGWVQVVLAAIAMTVTLPGRTYGLGLIKEPLRRDLGIGDVRFSLLNFWAIILGAVVVLPVGRLIDRLGSRIILTLVSAALAASVFAMSWAENETQLFISLTCVRGFGQGALSVVAIAMVGKWFRKRAPLAMGLFAVLLGIGFVIPLDLLKSMIVTEGWRATWAVVAYSIFAFAALGLLFARSTSESLGLRPDDPVEETNLSQHSTKLLAALRTPAFWVFTITGALFGLAFSAITLDNELLLKERSISGEKVDQTILGTLFVTGLLANLMAGGLTKKVPLPKLFAGGSLALAGSLIAFPFVTTLDEAIGYATMLGVSGGIITVVYFAIYGHYYGREHLGAIQAAAQVCSVFASAIGPVLLAQCRESLGKTDAFFFTTAGLAVLFAALCWMVRPPLAQGDA